MKIQLDTSAKTIKIENDVKLFELFTNLKKLLPDDEWKGFTLLTNTQITYWNDPIYVQPIYKHYYQQPWYYCNSLKSSNNLGLNKSITTTAEYKANNNADYSLKAGTYNIEL